MPGQVESMDLLSTPPEKIARRLRQGHFRFDLRGFSPAGPLGVTQKPTPWINQGVASQLVVNSSFTNQRGDSFSRSGVNLEAKV
jgi:hypothetical protein